MKFRLTKRLAQFITENPRKHYKKSRFQRMIARFSKREQEQKQGESEPIAKCRYHLSCSFCKYDWWSEEAFPKKCPKCRTEFMK